MWFSYLQHGNLKFHGRNSIKNKKPFLCMLREMQWFSEEFVINTTTFMSWKPRQNLKRGICHHKHQPLAVPNSLKFARRTSSGRIVAFHTMRIWTCLVNFQDRMTTSIKLLSFPPPLITSLHGHPHKIHPMGLRSVLVLRHRTRPGR